MAGVNHTRPHCVNQMGKTHSKPLAARHGRGTAWTRHAMCESAFRIFKKKNSLSTRNVDNFMTSVQKQKLFASKTLKRLQGRYHARLALWRENSIAHIL